MIIPGKDRFNELLVSKRYAFHYLLELRACSRKVSVSERAGLIVTLIGIDYSTYMDILSKSNCAEVRRVCIEVCGGESIPIGIYQSNWLFSNKQRLLDLGVTPQVFSCLKHLGYVPVKSVYMGKGKYMYSVPNRPWAEGLFV